jgi:ABC-2 type transport system ATP-binding protein
MGSEVVLALHSVTIRYDRVVAVDQLSLQVHAGEVFGLLGPNGSGKSSTIAAISGLLPIAAGSICLNNCDWADDPDACRRVLGLVPQDLALFEDLTAEQNLLFFGRLYGLRGATLRQRLTEVLRFIHLTEVAHRPVRTYSGGMQRRLNLGCALLHQPRLLLLDEPTVGLDIQSRDAIFASLRQLREQGTAIVFTTHHLEEAELLCDRLAIMDHGRLLALGSLSELCAGSPPLWRRDGPHRLMPHRLGRWGLERVFLELTGGSLRDS